MSNNQNLPESRPQNIPRKRRGAGALPAVSSIEPLQRQAGIDPITDAARAFDQSISRFAAGRPAARAVALLIGEQGKRWFGSAVKQYDELTSLQRGSRQFEKHKPRDVAISIGVWWKSLSPFRITMVDAGIHAYMLANGAPLPGNCDSWKKARRRICKNVYGALNPGSKMSDGWRACWLARYPLTARAMSAVEFKPGRRARKIYPRVGIKSAS
ncbi:hypothetical protein IMX07_02455 [bacterium]|nr:hypothetical protein [bacterium]